MLSYPLEDLLPPDVRQPAIQLFDFSHDAVNLALVFTLNLARLANRNVDAQLDAAHRRAGTGEPAPDADGGRP